MHKKLLTVAIAAALLSMGSPALAAEKAAEQAAPAAVEFKLVGEGTGIAAWGILGGWGNGLGLGARYVMPLIPGGVLKGSVPSFKKDSIEIEAGADFVRYSFAWAWIDTSYNVLRPAVGAKWSLWLNDQFAVYPKLELGFDISWWSSTNWPYGYTPESHTGIYFDAAAGVLYRIASKFDLRAELGIDGIRAGVAFNF
jgi:hypothetical protein